MCACVCVSVLVCAGVRLCACVYACECGCVLVCARALLFVGVCVCADACLCVGACIRMCSGDTATCDSSLSFVRLCVRVATCARLRDMFCFAMHSVALLCFSRRFALAAECTSSALLRVALRRSVFLRYALHGFASAALPASCTAVSSTR